MFGGSMTMPSGQPPPPPSLPPHQPHPPSFGGGQPPWSTPTPGQNGGGGGQWPGQQYAPAISAAAPPAAAPHFYDSRVQYQYSQPGSAPFYQHDDHFGDPFGSNGGVGVSASGGYPGLPEPPVRTNGAGNGFSPGPSYLVSTGADKGSHLLIPVSGSSILPKPSPLAPHPLGRPGLMVSTTITPLSHAPQLSTSLNFQVSDCPQRQG